MEVEVRTRRDDGHLAGAKGSSNRILGRYRVVAELGRGSTSIVYLAAVDGPAGFNKLFALKQLRSTLAEDPALVAMFLAEARIGAGLNHPNVVSTLEIDETERLPFIVMEYLDGQPLQNLIASARMAFTPLPLHMHLAALSGALEGLGHAHDALGPDGVPLGIVHRDVSPHNVFVTSSGMAKLLDFGFAQTTGAPNTMLSSAGRVAYWSPEQASGNAVDSRSDLFAVGVMLWEATTRRRFWSEEASKAEIVRALASGELPSTRESALARTPEDLRSIVIKATAPDPSGRYDSAASFQSDLHDVIRRVTPPSFSLRDLGQRLTTLFATERARLQATIDRQRENAMASNSAEGVARAPARGEDASSVAAMTPAAPIERPVETAPSEPAPKVETVNEDPLPSFPMPTIEKRESPSLPVERKGRSPNRRTAAIGAIALLVLIGIGLSVLHGRASHRPLASVSESVVTVAPDTVAPDIATGNPVVADPLATAASLPGPRESSVVEAAAPSMPAPPIVPIAEVARSEPTPSGPTPLVARAHAAGPTVPRPSSVATAPAGSKPAAEGRRAGETPVRVSDGNASAAHPPHPIDSTNPYSP